MYLTQSNVIRGLSKQEYTMLREMCQYSNNLYNVAVYTIRQHYFDTQQFLRYEENYPICKENENYGLLQAGVAQQILKMADRSFRSFFGLLQKVKSGDYGSKAVRLPYYREKDGFLTVPMSREYMKRHNGHRIRIPVPDRLKDKKIKEVRIPLRPAAWIWTTFPYTSRIHPIQERSAGNESSAACTASPTAGRPMPTSTAPPIYFVKVSRTSISRDCVRGFWTAL